MQDIENVSVRYIKQWETRANVRQPDRYRVEPGVDPAAIANAHLVPTLSHPLVQEMGEETKRILVMQFVYEYLKTVADNEGQVILSICGEAGSSLARDFLPPVTRRALQTVSTDEGFHTYVAEEMIDDLVAVTGIDHIRPDDWFGSQTMIAEGVTLARSRALPEARMIVHLAFIGLLENSITEEMIELLRMTERESPFYEFNREHVRDEARHSWLFRAILRHLWTTMDPDLRASVSENLPTVLAYYLRSFTTPFRDFEQYRLEQVGMEPEKAKLVIDETFARKFDPRTHPMWVNLWACLRETGLLEDPVLYRGLQRERLAIEDKQAVLAA